MVSDDSLTVRVTVFSGIVLTTFFGSIMKLCSTCRKQGLAIMCVMASRMIQGKGCSLAPTLLNVSSVTSSLSVRCLESDKQKVTFVCKIKVVLEYKKNVSMRCQTALEADQKGPRCIQKAPQKASRTRDATREIQKTSPGGGLGAQRRPRGPTSNFCLFESLLWEPSGDPPGGAVGARK